ncbi:hypothetical protein SAY87_028523 [Trapa incisa]|uniref:Uncharacterized protein n=1 Tax=Trapa incisa TaxID=236973 RepID=A0AAN7KXZ7_9MYRT|nr:hypothetical protein SAY87_028523 [Trapa incisa]
MGSYRSLRHELESSTPSLGLFKSTENANWADGSWRRGRFSVEVWLEGGPEKGGDGVGDAGKWYLSLPGPTLIGRGEGGVGGDEDGDV